MDRRFIFMKKNVPRGVVCPCPGAMYMHMTIIFKHLLLGNRLANQSQTGHMTKMAAMAINSENLYKYFSSEPEDL